MTYREHYYRLYCTVLREISHLNDMACTAEDRFLCIEFPNEDNYKYLYDYLLDELDKAVNVLDRARVEI